MGTATCGNWSGCSTAQKHFVPLWGQQRFQDKLVISSAVETFHTPMGTATLSAERAAIACRETFHTPMGTATQRLAS